MNLNTLGVYKPATLVQQKYNSAVVFEHNNGENTKKINEGAL